MGSPKIAKGSKIVIDGSAASMLSAIIMNGLAVMGGAQLNTVYVLNSENDAIDLGLDAAYDTANEVKVYHHIERFFYFASLGAKAAGRKGAGPLVIYLTAQGVTLANMADKTQPYLNAVLSTNISNGKYNGLIRRVAFIRNPASGGYALPAIETPHWFEADSYTAIVNAQAAQLAQAALGRPFQAVVELRGYNPDNFADTFDLTTMNCPDVLAFGGQDLDIALAETVFNYYAEAAAALGALAGGLVNWDMGWTAVYPAQDLPNGFLVNAGIGGNAIEDYEGTPDDFGNNGYDELSDKGYSFFRPYSPENGYFFSGDETCAPAAGGFGQAHFNQAWNEAARRLTIYTIANTRAPQKVSPATGLLSIATAKGIEKAMEATCNDLLLSGEIDGISVSIANNVSLLTNGGELDYTAEIITGAESKKISGTLFIASSL